MPTDTVPAVAPNGDDYDIPIDKIDYYKSLPGWEVENPLETPGKELETGAIGAAHGLIPGAPRLISDIGGPGLKEQKKLAETNPAAYGVGKFGGAVGQMGAVVGSAGALAPEAAAGAAAETLVPEVAEAAAETLPATEAAEGVKAGADAAKAADAAGASPEAINAAAKEQSLVTPTPEESVAATNIASSPYAQQAIAGATSEGTQYTNEAELGDHDFNGQSLAIRMGLGALTGAVAEGGVRVLGDTIAPPIIEKASQAVDAMKEGLGKAFFKASDVANGLESGTTEAAGKAIAAGAKPITDSEADELANMVNKEADAQEEVSKALHGQDRGADAAKNLADVSRESVLGEGPNTDMGQMDALPGAQAYPRDISGPGLRNVGERVSQALDGLTEGGKPLSVAKKAVSDWQTVLEDPTASAADLHAATLEAKQAVGDSGIYRILRNRNLEGSPQWDAMRDLEQKVLNPLKDALRDKGIFGEAQAAINKEIDAAATKSINARKQLIKDLGSSEIELESGVKESYLKPSKLRDAINGDPSRAQEKLRHLAEYEEASKEYLKVATDVAGRAGRVNPGGKDLEALLESITNTRRAAEQYQPIKRLLTGVRQQAPLGVGAVGAGPLAGTIAHMAGLGGPGAVAIGGGVAALRAPVKAMQMYAKIAGASAAVKDAIGSGVRRILSAPARAGFKGAASLAGRTIRDSSGIGSEIFEKQAENIGNLAGDQQKLIQNLAQNTSSLRDTAPNTMMALHQTAAAGIQALWHALPKNPAPSPLLSENKNWKPSPSEMQAWKELHSAILKPDSYLDSMANGTANPATWATLQKVYPAWAQQVQKQTIDYLSKPNLTLTPAQKLAVSIIVGGPVSPTVSPEQIMFQQQTYMQPQAAPGGPSKKPTQHGLDKLDLGERSALGTRSRHGS